MHEDTPDEFNSGRTSELKIEEQEDTAQEYEFPLEIDGQFEESKDMYEENDTFSHEGSNKEAKSEKSKRPSMK